MSSAVIAGTTVEACSPAREAGTRLYRSMWSPDTTLHPPQEPHESAGLWSAHPPHHHVARDSSVIRESDRDKHPRSSTSRAMTLAPSLPPFPVMPCTHTPSTRPPQPTCVRRRLGEDTGVELVESQVVEPGGSEGAAVRGLRVAGQDVRGLRAEARHPLPVALVRHHVRGGKVDQAAQHPRRITALERLERRVVEKGGQVGGAGDADDG